MAEIIRIGGVSCEVCLCITCGIPFGVPLTMVEQHRQYGGFHSCPSGHRQGWDKEGSELDRTRRERDRFQQAVAERDDHLRAVTRERDAARLAAAGLERERKRVLTRSNNAVCQDCNRSFANVARHRATKHKLKCEPVRQFNERHRTHRTQQSTRADPG